MKKITLLVALVVMTIFASAQTKQYFWLDGKLMFGTQIASTDSLTYGRENADSMMLYLPRTVTRTVHDTVTQIVHDTVIVIVHDTVYINGTDTSSASTPISSGLFSVSANTQVEFSPGNLQYQASTDTWRFAENQYDYIGESNTYVSPSYSGWIDLYGWGTGNDPTKKSTTSSDYNQFDEWGTNAISNGGNVTGQWRILTKDEWVYLFNTRTNAGNLYGMANVNGVNGMIILPDDWTSPTSAISFVSGTNSYSVNSYSLAQWEILESTGAVFLPAAGNRYNRDVWHAGEHGNYWSSTMYNSFSAYFVFFESNSINEQNDGNIAYAFAVRLVR